MNIDWKYDPTRHSLVLNDVGALPDLLSVLDTSVLNEGVGHDEWKKIIPWGEHIDEIEFVEGEEITSTGPAMFAWMENLKEVLLPKVQVVGNGTFYLCKNLERVYMPSVVFIGNGAFERCEKLCSTEEKGSKLVFRELRHISACAFHGCKSITAVTVTRSNRVTSEGKVIQGSGSKLEYVGEYAFGECENLSRFYDGGKESKAYKHETAFYGTQVTGTEESDEVDEQG